MKTIYIADDGKEFNNIIELKDSYKETYKTSSHKLQKQFFTMTGRWSSNL